MHMEWSSGSQDRGHLQRCSKPSASTQCQLLTQEPDDCHPATRRESVTQRDESRTWETKTQDSIWTKSTGRHKMDATGHHPHSGSAAGDWRGRLPWPPQPGSARPLTRSPSGSWWIGSPKRPPTDGEWWPFMRPTKTVSWTARWPGTQRLRQRGPARPCSKSTLALRHWCCEDPEQDLLGDQLLDWCHSCVDPAEVYQMWSKFSPGNAHQHPRDLLP